MASPTSRLLRLAVISAISASAADLSFSAPSVQPRQGAAVPVQVMFAPSEPVSSLQFDIEYDPDRVGVSLVVGAALRSSSKSLFVNEIVPGRKRFVVTGMNDTSIGAGSLIIFFLHLGQTEGVLSIRFSGALGATPDASPVLIASEDLMIEVSEPAAPESRLSLDGILNSASLLSGPIAPGELITIIGGNVQRAEDAEVRFEGASARIYYADAHQINAEVPCALTGKDSALLEILSQGEKMAQLSIPMAPTAPGVYTIDASGAGPGLIVNSDLTLNGLLQPAVKGSTVTFYATGTGHTCGDFPLSSIQIGAIESTVVSASPVPDAPAVVQIQTVLPDIAGDALDVLLRVGSAISQTGVKLSVH